MLILCHYNTVLKVVFIVCWSIFGSKLGFRPSRILDSLYGAIWRCFGGVHPPKMNRYGWNLEHSEYIIGAGTGRFWARPEQ